MKETDLKIVENSFFAYLRYEEFAREDIRKYIEYSKEFDRITVTENNNYIVLDIQGDSYYISLDRGYIVLEDEDNERIEAKVYLESPSELFDFIKDNLLQ